MEVLAHLRHRDPCPIVLPTPHENVAKGGLYGWSRTGNVPVLPPSLLAALHSSTDERSQDKPVPCRTGRCGRPRRPSSRVNLETLVARILAAPQRNIAVFETACRAGELVRAGLLRQTSPLEHYTRQARPWA